MEMGSGSDRGSPRVIGRQLPWNGQGLNFYRNCLFYHQLNGLTQDSNRLKSALAALADAREVILPGEPRIEKLRPA
jgi:hypothetical protein